jgi:tetratricopeptide (TPR) repeat protein
MIRILYIVPFFFIINFSYAQEDDLFSAANTVKYADFLYNTGDFHAAVLEYQRLCFMEPANEQYHYRLVKCYRLIGNYSLAIDHIDSLYGSVGLMPVNVMHEYLNNNLLNGDYEKTVQLVETTGLLGCDDRTFYQGVGLSLSGKTHEAILTLKSCPEISLRNNRILLSLNGYETFRSKKPAMAVAMSAIIPGSGKVYAGYWKDGLIAFSFVGLSAWQSYRGFKKKGIKSVYGWLYGVASVSFYLGNLYGSAKAANTYNLKRKELFYHNVEQIFIDSID